MLENNPIHSNIQHSKPLVLQHSNSRICNPAISQEMKVLKNVRIKKAYKALDLGRGPGVNRFKNGAYTLVREYFELVHNTATGQEMRLYKPFWARVMVNVLP